MVAAAFCLVLLLFSSLVHSTAAQCPQRTRVSPTELLVEIGGMALLQCIVDSSSSETVEGARFFRDGVAIIINGSKYTRSLAHGVNVGNIVLADEGEYTCLPEDSSCASDTVMGSLLGEHGALAHWYTSDRSTSCNIALFHHFLSFLV